MTKIAARRMLRIRLDQSPVSLASVFWRRRTNKGMIRSFEIMMESATVSTITIAVAAESPPTKATSAKVSCPENSGRDRT